ncbi:hypothetical protein IAT40_005738 [Kwoniella sp. CBS 6097]
MPPTRASAASSHSATPPPQTVAIPKALLSDPMFKSLASIRSYLSAKAIPVLEAESNLYSVVRFIEYRRDYEPPPGVGVMDSANKLRTDLTSARANSNANILDAIKALSDRIDEKLAKQTKDLKKHTSTEVDKLRIEFKRQRQEGSARRINRANTAVKAPWIAVVSHLNGQSRPNGVAEHITRRSDITSMEPDAVKRWLSLYGLPSGSGDDRNQEVLGDFLSGVTI